MPAAFLHEVGQRPGTQSVSNAPGRESVKDLPVDALYGAILGG